jgi:hypothetical protein
MSRIFALAVASCLTLMACGSATAAVTKILHCSDIKAIGFQWQDDEPKATRFVPIHFSVRLTGPGERFIIRPSQEYRDTLYHFVAAKSPKGAIACARPGNQNKFPIKFKDNNYERIGNMGRHVGGAPDLYVAYGTCKPF